MWVTRLNTRKSFHFRSDTFSMSILTNKGCNKETDEQMHCRNIRFGQDSNQGLRAPKANTITTELKRILPNIVVGYCT